MRMTSAWLIIGALTVFMASLFLMVAMPAMEIAEIGPSRIWRPWTQDEEAGNRLFVQNGCSYCHSQYIRVNDWDIGAERIAEAGDYYRKKVAIMGTERTGPDLSQEGGEHPDDWHLAHFVNPRFTRPESLMPSWKFLGADNLKLLIAYLQGEGMKDADYRVDRQKKWHAVATTAYESGPDANVQWLHDHIPVGWRAMPNPYPPTPAALTRGQRTFQTSCLGCHGAIGDGAGPASPYLYPPPLNFTSLRRNLVDGRFIGGILYHQIMNGITGTSMPYFKKELESEKIWDVSNYIAVFFIGYSDGHNEPHGIEASYEPYWPYSFPLDEINRKLTPRRTP